MNVRAHLLFIALALSITIFSGCGFPLPDSQSEVRAVYSRTDQSNRTNEVIILTHSEFAWRTFSPEPSQTFGYRAETRYYFSDRHVRRRPLRFLEPPNTGWEIFAPIESADYWMRVQGPDHFTRRTNELTVTLFSPQKLVCRQTIQTTEVPKTNYLHFTDGNRVLTYESGHDAFSYSVLQNRVTKEGAQQ